MMTDDEYLIKLGEKIASIRAEKKFKTVEFAERAGINRLTLQRVERGEHASSIIILRAIARELRVDLSELIDIEKTN